MALRRESNRYSSFLQAIANFLHSRHVLLAMLYAETTSSSPAGSEKAEPEPPEIVQGGMD
jgi:hypothetical protein